MKRARQAQEDDEADPSDQVEVEEVSYGVPVKNAFEILRNAQTTQPRDREPPLKPRTPPPIFIEQPPGEVMKRLTKYFGKYTIKYTGRGAKILTTDAETHNNIKTSLKEDNLGRFHTFPPRDQRRSRFVLYGLPKHTLEEAKQYLVEANINPADIKYMTINNPRYNGHCNYIVYFERTANITLKELQSVRAINHTIVKWAHYKAKENSVRPCQRCQTFGHGSVECGRSPRCAVCAQPHLTTACPLLIAKRTNAADQVDQSKLKCCNCGANHTSTFTHCPHRLSYIESRSFRRTRPAPRSKTFEIRPDEFPEFHRNNTPSASYRRPAPARSQWTREPTNSHTTTNSDEKLYTADECQKMLDDFYYNLRNCNTKQEQAKVIADFGIKYLCKFP